MNTRHIACNIILQFEKDRNRLDDIEQLYLSRSDFSTEQIRHLKNLTAGCLRHRTLLDWYSKQLYSGKFSRLINKVKVVLRLGLYEIIFMDNIPNHATVNEYVDLTKNLVNIKTAKLVNAILRSFIRTKDSLYAKLQLLTKDRLSILYSFPSWLLNRWISAWGIDFTENLCKAFNQIPEYSVRVNQTIITTKDFKELLIKNDVLFSESRKVRGFFKIKQIGRIRELGLFENGICSVQDESAGLPVRLLDLQKKDVFLDVCSAPGGKFTQALEETAELKMAVAVDNNKKRLLKVKENLKRLKLQGFLVVADANYLPFKTKFSKILIDAPCSGLGVIGKHPDIKWRRSVSEITEFSTLQKRILRNMASYLDKSGKLVYSTCTIDKSENEEVIEANMDKYTIMKLPHLDKVKSEDKFLRTYPSLHKMDGSFACLLKAN